MHSYLKKNEFLYINTEGFIPTNMKPWAGARHEAVDHHPMRTWQRTGPESYFPYIEKCPLFI